MKLAKSPDSISELRKNSRHILEKLRDLYRPKKFWNILNKANLCKSLNLVSDVQVNLHYLVNCYECYLSTQSGDLDFPTKKYNTLVKHLKILEDQITIALENGKMIPKRYISNVLKVQTVFFNSLNSKKANLNCNELYEKFVLSAIVVWNNDWQGRVTE